MTETHPGRFGPIESVPDAFARAEREIEAGRPLRAVHVGPRRHLQKIRVAGVNQARRAKRRQQRASRRRNRA
jgi:ribosomal protein S8E